MIGRVLAVALNTFREAVRDRVLHAVLACAVAVLLFSLALGELSLDQAERVVLDVGLASISLFTVVIAIFLGASLLYKELDRKTLYVILPRPLRRWEFVVGKYVGIVLTGLVFLGLMGAIQLWVAALQRGVSWPWAAGLPAALAAGGLAAVVPGPRDRSALAPALALGALAIGAGACLDAGVALAPVLAALALTAGELALLTAVALLFASFSTPFFTGVLAAGIWLVGRVTDDIVELPERALPEAVRSLLLGVTEVAPNFALFVPGRATLAGSLDGYGGPGAYVAGALVYAAGYAALTLAAAALIFRRRDLT